MSWIGYLVSHTKILILALAIFVPAIVFILVWLARNLSRHLAAMAVLVIVGAIAVMALRNGGIPTVATSSKDEKTTAKTLAAQIFPDGWKLTQWFRLDSDDDGVDEHLLLFRYNYGEKGKYQGAGPIGGVICDPRNAESSSPDVPDILSEMLLPDASPGKGQGYLAESRIVPMLCRSKSKGGVPELVIFGYSDAPWPTFLSIFRWNGKKYETVGHWAGDGGIEVTPEKLLPTPKTRVGDTPLDCDTLVEAVEVHTRLNERDLLCKKEFYSRYGSGAGFGKEGTTIGFCYHVPKHPFYPEGAVVAFYETLREKGLAEAQKAYMDDSGKDAWNRLSRRYPVEDAKRVHLLMLHYPSGFEASASEGVVVTVTVKVNTGRETYVADWGVAGRYGTPRAPKQPVEWRLHGVNFR